MLLGIIGAMPEEMDKVISAITNKTIVERGSRLYYRGLLFGQEVVAVFSRWGKVAAATTTLQMILEFNVDRIVFTGIAGAISPELNIGDIVIGERLYQHDMDARPLMRRFEIPLTGKTSFEISPVDLEIAKKAVHRFLLNNVDFRKMLAEHQIINTKFIVGDIASGDLFISSLQMKQSLSRNLPSVACAEMEGAAVAQVCADYEIPLIVIRVISDQADGKIHHLEGDFVNKHVGYYSLGILREIIEEMRKNSSEE